MCDIEDWTQASTLPLSYTWPASRLLTPFLRQGLTKYSASLGLTSIGRLLTQPQTGLQACTTNPSKNSIFVISKPKPFTYLRQPAVLVSTDSHSICRGLQSSLGSLSQPECGMITSSVKACNAWSTISILIESWDERFHRVPGRDKSESSSTQDKCVWRGSERALFYSFFIVLNDHRYVLLQSLYDSM